MDYINVTIKLIIGIIYAILIMRLSGLGNLAPLAPFDQINNYILGGIIGSVLFNKNISIIDYLFVLTLWAIITLTINFLKKKNQKFKNTIDGYTITIIEDGKIIRKGIEKAHLTVPDLYLKLRFLGHYDIKEIDLAQIEQNGQIIIMNKNEIKESITQIVMDGVINNNALENINKDKAWLEEKLKEQNIHNLKSIASVEYSNEEIRIIEFI